MLGALLAGIAIGLVLRAWGTPTTIMVADALKPLGRLWVQGLQMTLVPLVFTMVAGGVAAAVRAGTSARLIGGAMLIFVALSLVAALLGGVVTTVTLWAWPLPAEALAGLPTITTAAAGQMMPLVFFAILFGFAATRLPRRDGGGAIALLDDIAQIMLTIVEWVLWFAPAGIFILSLSAALHAGLGLASVLGHYVVLEIASALLAITGCYTLIGISEPLALKRFAKAAMAPQAMAAGTCSSMATLPAMIEAAITTLGISEPVAGTLLPLAVTCFRFASTASTMVGITLAAYAAGIHPSAVQLILAAVVTVLANMGSAGLPGAAVVYAVDAPGFQFLGAPLGLIPFYIAAIAIPDIFLTTANVTADLTVTMLLAGKVAVQQGFPAGVVEAAE